MVSVKSFEQAYADTWIHHPSKLAKWNVVSVHFFTEISEIILFIAQIFCLVYMDISFWDLRVSVCSDFWSLLITLCRSMSTIVCNSIALQSIPCDDPKQSRDSACFKQSCYQARFWHMSPDAYILNHKWNPWAIQIWSIKYSMWL